MRPALTADCPALTLTQGIVFDEIPHQGNGAWHYSLRFPSSNIPSLALSSVPSTSFNFDNRAIGLSSLYSQYLSSGFLSLQLSPKPTGHDD